MRSIEEISLLYEISEALNEHMDMKKSLYKVLGILADCLDLIKGTVTLLDPATQEIRIEVAHGISEKAKKRVRYKLGEGITGRVIQTGTPAVIPRISDDPAFLHRTDSRAPAEIKEYSFICVPVKKGNTVVGALSADRHYDGEEGLKKGEKIMGVVATMIARHVINLEALQLERENLKKENSRLKSELENRYSFTNIIGNSNKMREVFQMISQVSRSNATVLIRGESGTGKELVANSIHYNSLRNNHPFVKINCAALPENLIESELFGHEQGAFTGALHQKKGQV